jgi:hypothetical protein
MHQILIVLLFVGAGFGLEDPQARLAAITAKAEADTAAYAREWLGRARLDPLEIPKVDLTDAKPSEAQAVFDIRMTNDRLAEARRILASKPSDHDLAAFFTLPTIRAVLAAQDKPAVAKTNKDHPGK